MNQTEILERIKQLQNGITHAVNELQSSENSGFFISLIQQNTIELYQLVSTYPTAIKSNNIAEVLTKQIPTPTEPILPPKPEPVKPAVEEIVPIPETTPKIEVKVSTPSKKEELKPKNPIPDQMIEEAEEEEDLSINDKFSKNKQPVLNFAEKSKETPIKDLNKFISIGKKFEFINGLFDGQSDAYKSCLNTVESSASYDSAVEYLETSIVNNFDWTENEKLASEFFSLVRRRFNH